MEDYLRKIDELKKDPPGNILNNCVSQQELQETKDKTLLLTTAKLKAEKGKEEAEADRDKAAQRADDAEREKEDANEKAEALRAEAAKAAKAQRLFLVFRCGP